MATSQMRHLFYAAIFSSFLATSYGNDSATGYEEKDLVLEYEMYQDLGEQAGSPRLSKQTVKLKGNRRIMTMGGVSSFDDPETGDQISLFHSNKMFVRSSLSQMKEMSELVAESSTELKSNVVDSQQDSLAFKPTGRTAEINGYETEEYYWKGKSPVFPGQPEQTTEIRVWVAMDDPDATAVMKRLKALPESSLAGVAASTNPDFDSLPGLVVRQETITTIAMPGQSVLSKTKTTRTLTSFRQEEVSEAEFTIPEDYVDMKTHRGAPGDFKWW